MELYDIKLLEAIYAGKNICVAGHINPDGDAVGSVLAMGMCMKLIGKNVTVLLDEFSPKYNFLSGMDLIYKGDYNELNPDLFIVLDCGSKDRLGDAEKVFDKTEETICIDHHISNTEFAKYNVVYPDASSTAEIVFGLVKNFSAINTEIATALYTGIVADTGGFKHNSTSAKTHEIASVLIGYNVPCSKIQDRILYSKTENEVNVFIKALNKMKIENGISKILLSKEEILECGASYTDLDGIVGFITNIDTVEAALFIYEKEDGKIKISMRSKNIDVSSIAVDFGGGGHKPAAGADFEGTLEEAEAAVTKEIEAAIAAMR